MRALVLRDVVVEHDAVDVRCERGVVTQIAQSRTLAYDDEDVVLEGRNRRLLPGLHDHHIHLLATAAADRSVRVGPAEVGSRDAMAAALRRASEHLAPGEWIRAVGYHESVAGDLDRHALDGLVPDRPTRVQHRSGALWVLNTEACKAVGLLGTAGPVDGRLWRQDEWLRERLPPAAPADLADLGMRLARFGLTGVTDATPFSHQEELDAIAEAADAIPQRLTLMGGVTLATAEFPPTVVKGPVKVIVADHQLPTIDDLAGWFAEAHSHDRPVAAHCVSRVALVLALAAWDVAGVLPGDRIEHASVVPSQLIGRIAQLGLRVVTQPNFVAERGDEYLRDVEPAELGDLYRCRSLLDAGIALAAGTDAPFGDPDPWKAIRAATDRRTRDGELLGEGERITPDEALGLFLSPPDRPGDPARRVEVGAAADLVLLGAPGPDAVDATIIYGEVVFERSRM